MAAAKKTAAASGVPSLRPVEFQGATYQVDDSKVRDWKSYEYLESVFDPGENPFARTRALFGFVEHVAGATREEIVSNIGGDDVSAETVIAYITDLVRTIAPKN